MRCLSAVDVALWDILGQELGQPIWQILGGTSHPDGVLVYNTCASADYGQGTPGISRREHIAVASPYQDFEAWQPGGDAGVLARSLLDMGIRAMKIWPFDRFALANHGQTISFAEIEEGLRPWRQVRDAVGLEMDIILEGHGYWALQPARRIAEALEPYKPALLEDLMKPDNPRTLAKLRSSTRIPICTSELLMNRYAVEEMLQADACDVVMTDVTWAGGITESRKTANMAETNNMGVIFHDCTGPVTLAASLHLAAHATNTWMQEIVRAYTLRILSRSGRSPLRGREWAHAATPETGARSGIETGGAGKGRLPDYHIGLERDPITGSVARVRVGVLDLGLIGQFEAQLSRLSGARPVNGADLTPSRVESARVKRGVCPAPVSHKSAVRFCPQTQPALQPLIKVAARRYGLSRSLLEMVATL